MKDWLVGISIFHAVEEAWWASPRLEPFLICILFSFPSRVSTLFMPRCLSISPLLSVPSGCVKCMYYIRPHCCLSALCYLFWQVLWRNLFGWKNEAQHWARPPVCSMTASPPHSVRFYQQGYRLLTFIQRKEPVPRSPGIWKDEIITRLWLGVANSAVMTFSGHVAF